MSKKLSLLLSAVMLTAYNAHADHVVATSGKTELSLGGSFLSEIGAPIQNSKYKMKNGQNQVGSANNNNVAFTTGAAAHLSLVNRSDENFIYGAQIGLMTTTRSKDFVGKKHLDRSYIYFAGKNWGRIEFGSSVNAASSMIIQGNTNDAGEGNWDRYVSLSSFNKQNKYTTPVVYSNSFISSPGLVINEGKYHANHEASRKVTFYTPKVNGFQAGVSYIPDSGNKGGTTLEVGSPNESSEKNVAVLSFLYDHDLGNDRDLSLSVAGEIGDMKGTNADRSARVKFHKTRVFVVGGKYRSGDIYLAASYGNRGKTYFRKDIKDSANGKNISPSNGYYYAVGSMYQLNKKSQASLSYFGSRLNKNNFGLVTLAANYTPFSGVKLYSEISTFKGTQKRAYVVPGGTLPNGNTVQNNAAMVTGLNNKIKGTAFVTGVILNF